MKIISQMLVRNESGRWLREALDQAAFLSDEIVIVDDASSDDTVSICREYTDDVHETATSLFTFDERVQRERLWNLATSRARRNDWIVLFDADELLAPHDLEELKLLLHFKSLAVESLSLRLVDMWSENAYRDDQFWTAHQRQWIRLVRFQPTLANKFRDASHHCGSFPEGYEGRVGDTDLTIRHMGWSREADRRDKYHRYMEADPHGLHGWLAQYESILDPDPHLVLLD